MARILSFQPHAPVCNNTHVSRAECVISVPETSHKSLSKSGPKYLYIDILPACDVVEDRVPILGGPSLVEDVKGLESFELLFLMDLVPGGSKVAIGGGA